MVSGNSIVISEMKKAVQENTKHITAVKESFDAVCAEINDMKDRVANMERKSKNVRQTPKHRRGASLILRATRAVGILNLRAARSHPGLSVCFTGGKR